MDNSNKIYSLLGLSQKANKLASGEFMTEKAVKSREASLVIVATDASDNTKKEFGDMCAWYKVNYREFGSKEKLASAIGKEIRASLAVCDEGFAKSILKYLDEAPNRVEE